MPVNLRFYFLNVSSRHSLFRQPLGFRIFSVHLDDDLDGSEGGVGELGEAGGDVVEGEAVGNPEVGVDLSGGTAWMA